MKLKYYLQGLGIGILVTVLILGISPGEKEVLSDAEIRERAIELGMVDRDSLVLSEMSSLQNGQDGQTETSEQFANAENQQSSAEETVKNTETSENQSEVTSPNEVNDETTNVTDPIDPSEESSEIIESTEGEAGTDTEMVTIVVESGVHSYTVCKDLEAAGLIEDAKAFDNYLCNNGYSRSVCTGIYKIPLGTSEEEIAKIITRKR